VDYRPWARCPALASLDVNQSEMDGLFLARRGFWGDRVCKYRESCDALWSALWEDSK